MFLQNTPIRRKLMAVVLLTSGAVLILTCLSYVTFEILTFRRGMLSQLATLGEVIASNSTAALAFQSTEDGEQILSALRAKPNIVTAALYDARGQLFARFPATLPANALPATPQLDGHRFAGDGLDSFQPVIRNGKRLGTLYLRSNLEQLYERLWLQAIILILIVASACGLTFVISRVLQRQISEPILQLAETARAISERKDYSVRATKHGNDEVGRLTEAFNQMLDQIQQLNRDLEDRVVARTAELQAANQELEAFSYSVSHDLRAPLRHIGGYAAMLHGHARSSLDEKGRRYLSVIQESALRMGQLIDDLLEFSRTGRAEMRRTPVPLGRLIEQIWQSLQADVAGRKIVWEMSQLPVVAGDEALLRQVFTNLLANAVKYTRQRDEARIEVGLARAAANEAVVFVRDNGAGFDMKYAEKLFGVFQRLHDEEEFEGTGVGLATVRRIVQRHGGRVWAEARPQMGATFFASLPIAVNGSSVPAGNTPSAL